VLLIGNQAAAVDMGSMMIHAIGAMQCAMSVRKQQIEPHVVTFEVRKCGFR